MSFLPECIRCLVPGPMSLVLKLTALASLPLMVVSVVLIARLVERGSARERALIAVAFASPILFMFVPLLLTSDWPGRYSPMVLREGPFDWPSGCARRTYNDGDPISIACIVHRNEVPRKFVLEHGFRSSIGREDRSYYRVGSDAINFSCNYFKNTCSVGDVERNVFRE